MKSFITHSDCYMSSGLKTWVGVKWQQGGHAYTCPWGVKSQRVACNESAMFDAKWAVPVKIVGGLYTQTFARCSRNKINSIRQHCNDQHVTWREGGVDAKINRQEITFCTLNNKCSVYKILVHQKKISKNPKNPKNPKKSEKSKKSEEIRKITKKFERSEKL